MSENFILRDTVAMIILNKDKKILMCEHSWIDNAYQFPQGGIENDESEEDAVFRELYEEIGTKSIKIIKKMDEKIKYILPYDLRRKYGKDGQTQRYFLLYFFGDDSEIRFDNQQKPEFKSFKWVDFDEPVKKVIYFKKLAYKKALDYFKEDIKNVDLSSL